jgi:response regulator RpfG family c-di-GMP phosphodiesterase
MSKEQKRTILCVDDEQDILDSLFDELMDGYNVLTTTNPIEGLNYFDTNDIALVISDQRMPQMTGSEFLAKVHAKKPICKKILLTGYSDINAAIDAINLGSVDKYFNKPWDPEELLDAIANLLSIYKMDEFFDRVLQQGKDMKATIKAEEGRSRGFQDFLDNYATALCILDENGVIEYINNTGAEIFKYDSAQEMVGINLLEKCLAVTPSDFIEQYVKQGKELNRLSVTASDGSMHSLPSTLVCKQTDDGRQLCGIVFDTF